MSHGEHRQLEIAMALATGPRMLLLDEPMAGMGPEESARMVKMLLELKKQYTILLIEHDMEAVFALADRISVLVYGRVIATGAPAEIRANPEVRQAYLGEQEARVMADTLLEIAGIETCYGRSQVLFGLSLAIAPGEMVTLMGRNGMGKTTTVRSIMGLTPARAGTIRFGGKDIRGLAVVSRRQARRRPGAGRPADFPESDGARESGRDRRQSSGAAKPWTYDSVVELFPRLAERAGQMGNLLSGGEQQMLAIGRALMTNPRLLILDEATEGLAPLIRQEIWQCLTRLKQAGQSILVIDKNVAALIAIADRHYLIERGRTVWSGTSRELAAAPEVQHRYLGV